ncbi:Hypothetical predicted protein, partial [Paramuricea clavata]
MLYVLHEIHNVLEKRGQVDTIYLDFAKAFDKVSHDLLLVKLHNFGIRGNLLRWFGDYLSGRLQRVTVLGVTSEPLPVLSGVPQGSILGPLLFLIYVNDLPMSTSHDTTLSMFADDTKCHRHLRNFQDTIILQQDLDSVANWCNDWRMDLNQTKCVVMHFSRIAQPMITQYTISDTPVLQSSSQKDLGITTTNDLKWNKQVQEISTKANKMLGFVKRTAFDIRQRRVRKVLYLTMVRSQLAYGSQFIMPPKGSKSSKRKSSKSPANPSPSQRPRVQTRSSTIALEPTIASPSAGATTSSTVHEPVNVASTSATPDASTISPQLLQQIVSTVTAEVTRRLTPHHQAEFSDAVVEAPVVAMGASTSTEQPAIVSGIVEEALKSVHSAVA